jgi:hypothetical protein
MNFALFLRKGKQLLVLVEIVMQEYMYTQDVLATI